MTRKCQRKPRKGLPPIAYKRRMLDLNLSVNALARQIIRPRETISRVLNGSLRFPKLEARIREVLGL